MHAKNSEGVHALSHRSIIHKITDSVPVVPPQFSLAATQDYLARYIKNFETIHYIYVVGEEKKLLGVFSIKELYRLPPETSVSSVMKRDLVTVHPHSFQEQTADLALEHAIKAMPVVDERGVFHGVVPSDTILRILHRELRDDVLQMAGIHRSHLEYDNVLTIPLWTAVRHRILWLVIGLLGGIIAAKIIAQFAATLEKNLLIAAFIPLVVYVASAVGTQLEAFAIRDFALVRKLDFRHYFARQFFVVFVLAFILGIVSVAASAALNAGWLVMLIIGTAVFSATLSSVVIGLVIPFALRTVNIDPANASGPIATIIQDITSIVIYFGIATLIL